MKVAGYVLLIAGFLLAAYATALDTEGTSWPLFLPAAVGAAVGVLLVKRHARGEAKSDSVLSANRAELTESIGNIVAVLDELAAASGVTDFRQQIDERLRDDLRRFADARKSIVHLYSLQVYASVMSEFAAGERYLNRVWSASADGFAEEASRYLERAAAQFRDVRAQLEAAA